MEASFASAVQHQRVRQDRAQLKRAIGVFRSPIAVAVYATIVAAVLLLLIRPPFVENGSTNNESARVSIVKVGAVSLATGALAFLLPLLFAKLATTTKSRSRPA